MLRKIAMVAAVLLICLPPGIEGLDSLPTVRAEVDVAPRPPTRLLFGPGELAAACACLTVLCLLDTRQRQERQTT